MTKEQWLKQTIMFDDYGRPPSLADVPLQYGTREQSFKLRKLTEKEMDELYKKENKND